MASLLSGDGSHHGAPGGNNRASQANLDEGGGRWYFSRKEIEENSPSRRDGIDLKKETYLRKSYCTFLQDLGMRLKVPQVTIATAIIFCHRFFIRQSHAKNERRTIATVCMFLAGKVEETPRPLKDVIIVSYEIIHKKDAEAVQMIKQKDVYEKQKELILLGERVVLGTLGFDLNIQHPYKPLVEAIKKFKVAQNALAQVAWNFVNDGLRTSLCLQFKPHHIAAGAIFLAAKFLKVKLPSDGEKVWWQEFDVTPRQLEEVSNQMLELYEQNRIPQSQVSEAEGSAGGSQRPLTKVPSEEDHVLRNSSSHGGNASKASSSKPPQLRLASDQQDTSNHSGPSRTTQPRNDSGSAEASTNPDRRGDNELHDVHGQELVPQKGNSVQIQNKSKSVVEGHENNDQEGGGSVQIELRDGIEMKEKYHSRNLSNRDSKVSQAPHDAKKKLDKEKIKAAIERRKARGDINKMDSMDELERELEDVEVAVESEKTKREKKQTWSKPLNRPEHETSHSMRYANEAKVDFDAVEEGEVAPSDELDRGYRSPRKRKPGSPLERNGVGRPGYSERDHKRHLQENHV